jgi:hypothetical protein
VYVHCVYGGAAVQLAGQGLQWVLWSGASLTPSGADGNHENGGELLNMEWEGGDAEMYKSRVGREAAHTNKIICIGKQYSACHNACTTH